MAVHRRQALKQLCQSTALGFIASGFVGCAFHLRQAGELSFSKMALEGFDRASLLLPELRRQLPATLEMVASPQQAQVIFRVLHEIRAKRAVAMTATGLTRAYELRVQIAFQLISSTEKILIPPATFLLTRPLSTTESAVLAKMHEEEEIYAEMTRDITSQIVRRLEAVKLPPPAIPEKG
jgi:outer membrane lipopolysaccharide assembly protein LptE/RlpB